MKITPTECSTTNEFLNIISLCNKFWWDDEIDCHWIFRGQASNHDLIPSLYRSNYNGKDLSHYYQAAIEATENDMGLKKDFKPNIAEMRIRSSSLFQNGLVEETKVLQLAEIIKAGYIEIYLTEEFLLKCNEIPLPIPTVNLFPGQDTSIRSTRVFQSKIDELIKNFLQFYRHNDPRDFLKYRGKFIPGISADSLALARHHLIPSRLLDWTKDPLVAAAFAANTDNDTDLCIWALNKFPLNKNPGSGCVEFHDRLSRTGLEFLHIQKGLFTDMIGADMYHFLHGYWPTLDEYLMKTYVDPHTEQSYDQDAYLKKITLPASQKITLIKKLNAMGYSRHSLMPTYDNVGKVVCAI